MTKTWKPKLISSEAPLYMAIVKALEKDIRSERLAPGTKLPTQRALARACGIAIGTVTRAYAEAEQQGWIHGDGRRGTFVGQSPRRESSLTSLAESKPGTLDMSMNHPTPAFDPNLRLALKNLSRQSDIQQLLVYPPLEGSDRHRQAGSEWIKGLGLDVDPGAVVLAYGAQWAMSAIFQTIAKPGDRIMTEALTYPGIKSVADAQDLELVGVPMDAKGILPDALESVCKKTKSRILYMVPTLQNPTNSVMPLSRKKKIVSIAERYDLTLVEDEIHRRLVTRPPRLFADLARDRTFLMASPSKVIAGGLRIGFVAAPPDAHRDLVNTGMAMSLVVSPLLAEIFALWLENGTTEEVIRQRRMESEKRQQIAKEVLGAFTMQSNPSSYFLWLKLPGSWTSAQFTLQAQRMGIAVAPADLFAVPGTEVPEAVRICLSEPESRKALEEALQVLADILENPPRFDTSAM